MCTRFVSLIEEVEFLDAERRYLAAVGPHFRIHHRLRQPGSICEAGEEVVGIFAVHNGREFHVPLSLALRLVFDFLAHHPHLPQSASQVQAAMRSDPFYAKHGFNAMRGGQLVRKITRSAIKQYVSRIRRALELTFREAHLSINPQSVVISKKTVTNEIGYHIRGTFQWVHTDLPERA
jgi:hypothetical protein